MSIRKFCEFAVIVVEAPLLLVTAAFVGVLLLPVGASFALEAGVERITSALELREQKRVRQAVENALEDKGFDNQTTETVLLFLKNDQIEGGGHL